MSFDRSPASGDSGTYVSAQFPTAQTYIVNPVAFTGYGIATRLQNAKVDLLVPDLLNSSAPIDDFRAFVQQWGLDGVKVLLTALRTREEDELRWIFIEELGNITDPQSERARAELLYEILRSVGYDGDRCAAASGLGNMDLPVATDWLQRQSEQENNKYVFSVIKAKIAYLKGRNAKTLASTEQESMGIVP